VLERQEGGVHSMWYHETESQGDFQYASGNVVKPKRVENCNSHMGCMDKSDRISYECSQRLGTGQKSCFCSLLDLSVLNAFKVQEACGGKVTLLWFREQLVCDLLSAAQNTLFSMCTPRIFPLGGGGVVC
jgi:hypothetical protein